jgi:hypothetical protein
MEIYAKEAGFGARERETEMEETVNARRDFN